MPPQLLPFGRSSPVPPQLLPSLWTAPSRLPTAPSLHPPSIDVTSPHRLRLLPQAVGDGLPPQGVAAEVETSNRAAAATSSSTGNNVWCLAVQRKSSDPLYAAHPCPISHYLLHAIGGRQCRPKSGPGFQRLVFFRPPHASPSPPSALGWRCRCSSKRFCCPSAAVFSPADQIQQTQRPQWPSLLQPAHRTAKPPSVSAPSQSPGSQFPWDLIAYCHFVIGLDIQALLP